MEDDETVLVRNDPVFNRLSERMRCRLTEQLSHFGRSKFAEVHHVAASSVGASLDCSVEVGIGPFRWSIKLFSVLAVIFMPPTVIASIYGMNFKEMPELEWHLGYPIAIESMTWAAAGPYLFFRRKKWL
jgi:hypothetical protein